LKFIFFFHSNDEFEIAHYVAAGCLAAYSGNCTPMENNGGEFQAVRQRKKMTRKARLVRSDGSAGQSLTGV